MKREAWVKYGLPFGLMGALCLLNVVGVLGFNATAASTSSMWPARPAGKLMLETFRYQEGGLLVVGWKKANPDVDISEGNRSLPVERDSKGRPMVRVVTHFTDDTIVVIWREDVPQEEPRKWPPWMGNYDVELCSGQPGIDRCPIDSQKSETLAGE